MTNKPNYHYMIGFIARNGSEYGNLELTLVAPISSMRHVAAVQENLRRHYGKPDMIILSFSLFPEATR